MYVVLLGLCLEVSYLLWSHQNRGLVLVTVDHT